MADDDQKLKTASRPRSDREREALIDRLEAEIEAYRGDRQRRHWVQVLGTLGLVGSGARELYRRKYLESLPSLRHRSKEGVGEWEMSWHPERDQVPEGAAQAGGYALLVALASAGGPRRASEHPLVSLAAAGLSLIQAGSSLKRLVDELEQGEVDVASSIDTVLTASTVPLTIPEAFRALKNVIGRRRD